MVIPLTGQGTFQGNLRIVLDEEKQRVEVHYTVPVRTRQASGDPQAVDLGVTEMMSDSDGDCWGKEFGQRLAAYSDRICDKGRKRNRLHAQARQAEEQGNKAKAKRIRKYNLGQQKQRRERCRMRRR